MSITHPRKTETNNKKNPESKDPEPDIERKTIIPTQWLKEVSTKYHSTHDSHLSPY